MEMRASRTVAVVACASQAAPSRKLGTSHAKARAKAEAGKSRNKMVKKAPFSRARVALVNRSRIRVVDSLGTATFAARQATGQPTACKREECKP